MLTVPSFARHVAMSRARVAEVDNGFWKRDKRGRFAETEGGGAGIGEDLIAAGGAEELAQAALDAAGGEVPHPRKLYTGGEAPGIGAHGDEALHHIAVQQGFDGLATRATSRQMREEIKAGGKEMFRGVKGGARAGGKTAEQIHEQIRSGEDYQGLGAFGNGSYFSGGRDVAATYGTVGRYALHREARTVGYDALATEHEGYLRSLPAESAARRVFSDPGRYAAARGYDAIHVVRAGQAPGGENEYVVLNRTALLAEES